MCLPNKKGYVGTARRTCRICGQSGEFQIYMGREMMQGSGDLFRYFSCSVCDCLQIEAVPEDLSKYYGESYYSYSKPNIQDCSGGISSSGEYILDVGCGAGEWLCDIARKGYKNLFGCDPLIERDLEYPNGVKIKKSTIHEMEGSFDVIRLADSFEHMEDPLDVFCAIKRLLKPAGYCWLSIPVYPNAAFELFGADWYQMDPPRHLFLHSQRSIQYLADKSGLLVHKVEFDSNNSQFVRSKMYQCDVPFYEQTPERCGEYITRAEDEKYRAEAEIANKNQTGDHAVFYLTHDNRKRDGADRRQVLALSDSITEALEYLVARGKEGNIEKHLYLLQDVLQAHKAMRKKL